MHSLEEQSEKTALSDKEREDYTTNIILELNAYSPFGHAEYIHNFSDENIVLFNEIIQLIKTNKIHYNKQMSRQTVNRCLRALRKNGWVKLPIKLTDESVDLLIQISTIMTQIYDNILKTTESSVQEIIDKGSDEYKQVKYRDGRIDILVPFFLKLFQNASQQHPWL